MFCKANRRLFALIAATSVLITSFLRNTQLSVLLQPVALYEYSNILEKKWGYQQRKPLSHITGQNFTFFSLDELLLFAGWICALPLANSLGRKWSIVYSNILRLLALALYVIGMCSYAYFKEMIDNFLWMAQLCESVYAGLLTFLGPLYVYEILPGKPSAEVGTMCAASGISLYLFFSSFAQYLRYITFPNLTVEPFWNYSWWCVSGVTLGFSLILQTFLFAKYFPESPAYIAIQRNQSEETTGALEMLRTINRNELEVNPEENTNPERDEVQTDLQVRDCAKRSGYLMMLYYLLHMHVYFVRNFEKILYEGELHLVNSLSYLFVFIVYKWNQNYFKLETLRKYLFSAYTSLTVIFPILHIFVLYPNGKYVYLKRLLFFSFFITWVCTEVITTTLLLKYPRHANRAKNYYCAHFQGIGFCMVIIFLLSFSHMRTAETLAILWLIWIGMLVFVKIRDKNYNANPYEVTANT